MKRWWVAHTDDIGYDMEEDPEGEYVLWEDAKAAVETLEALSRYYPRLVARAKEVIAAEHPTYVIATHHDGIDKDWFRDTLKDAMRSVRRIQNWATETIYVSRCPGQTIWLWKPGTALKGTHTVTPKERIQEYDEKVATALKAAIARPEGSLDEVRATIKDAEKCRRELISYIVDLETA